LNNFFKYLFGLFSVVLFITATTGVTVHSHYCSSDAVANISIIESLATCGHHAESTEPNPSIEGKSCCQIDSQCKTLQVDKDDCCSNESEFYRVSDDFTTSSEEQWKVISKEISIVNTVISIVNESIEKSIFSNGLIEIFHPPPSKSGKQLIVFLQQQKTDPDPIA